MKISPKLLLGLAAGLLSQGSAGATDIFYDRGDWLDAFIGPHWDVDLEGKDGRNEFTDGGTLNAGSPIQLPPLFTETLSFNRDLGIQRGGSEWNNYINPSGGPPLVLATGSSSLIGTFSQDGFGKFGFEILSALGSEITLTLSDGTVSIPVDATGTPQFFGWITASGDAIENFTISSTGSGFLIGNFVVPDTGATLGLFGIGFLVLATARHRFA